MAIFEFVEKQPDKAYVSNKLWIPKSKIRSQALQNALEFYVSGPDGQEILRLWSESKHHIIAPREFIPVSQYPNYKFPFVDLRPSFGSIEVEDLVVPRDGEQEKAWQALAANNNGILNLACGKGKTKLAVKKIAQRKTPTLVIVPDGGILSQWQEAILGSHRTAPGLKLNDELGLIQADAFDWQHSVTLALVTTLAIRIKNGDVPPEMFRYFGQIIYDEVHRIGAPMFSLTAEPFYGDRIGLTATVQREDGLDPIYRYNIGEPFYTDLSQELIPRIYFWQTPSHYDWESCKINNIINISKLRSKAGMNLTGNTYRYYAIKEALDQGRKVLCLSHSRNQLFLMASLFPEAGIITSKTKKHERMAILRNSQVCFAISKLGSEGIDDDKLDTLFWLTPFKSRISLQQSMGRIQRPLPDKKQPVMVVFEDWFVPPMKNLCRELRSRLSHWGYKVENLAPMPFPLELPTEGQSKYNDTYAYLHEDTEV
jgi:superfamily II DNA or RNA helicase